MNQANAIFEKYWGFFALFAWIGLAILLDLVRFTPFAIDEAAARGLLLTWTIADNVVNPIVIFGMPDFRALLFAPVGAYWPGSMLATKIMALTIAFVAVTMLFRWSRRTTDPEVALIASALLLLSPIMVSQVDSLSAGPYILMAFASGAWLDSAYRKDKNYFGGWYFCQMLWIAILTTLHPIALAYPIALAWQWYRNPHAEKKSRHVYIGIAVSVLLTLSMTLGWSEIEFFSNPFAALAEGLQGSIIWSAADLRWVPGIIAGLLLALLISLDFKTLSKDLLGQMILISIAIGVFMPDQSWVLICIALLLYRGTHLVVKFNQSRNKTGRVGQRGIVMGATLFLCAFFMLQDKNHALTIKHAILGPEDEMIQSLMVEAEDPLKPFRAASEWPGRTMLATKRDVLPLPPALDDPEKMLEAVRSVTHIIFNPFIEKNKALADSISALGGETETLALYKAGAIIQVRNNNVPLSTSQRLAKAEIKKDDETKDTQTSLEDTTAEHNVK
ncbi:MAG: hypothetical protein OEM38_00820 [Gammaproteobacteria bacterium]|nr:hypothetical protein [Gammaproteobacteria bacterium]